MKGLRAWGFKEWALVVAMDFLSKPESSSFSSEVKGWEEEESPHRQVNVSYVVPLLEVRPLPFAIAIG